MKYTGPKFKLCRREWVNIFQVPKYDVKKRRNLPGQHGKMMARLSDYGKLLRNKQLLKRTYLLSEKQFKKIVVDVAAKYSKNKNVEYDKAVLMMLERRMDVTILRAGLAKTIMQARQMVNHGHFLLNWKKHNIPSYMVKKSDIITLRERLKDSPLYKDVPVQDWKFIPPSHLKVDKTSLEIKVTDLPNVDEIQVVADTLKVVEFYAR